MVHPYLCLLVGPAFVAERVTTKSLDAYGASVYALRSACEADSTFNFGLLLTQSVSVSPARRRSRSSG